ncbi:MAG: cupin domain-containing protein [Clostridia bacterium]|nr:cupin domain-containing protein [Clostridia bacterium]
MFYKSENNKDLGSQPQLLNIHNEVCRNTNFRTAIWTGKHLQVTVMSIPVGGEIGLESHDDLDQFIKVESGCATVYMGETKQNVKLVGKINSNYAIVIPAGTWHNVINSCACPLKVYSVYAPPQHPFGTIHQTKLDSDLAED